MKKWHTQTIAGQVFEAPSNHTLRPLTPSLPSPRLVHQYNQLELQPDHESYRNYISPSNHLFLFRQPKPFSPRSVITERILTGLVTPIVSPQKYIHLDAAVSSMSNERSLLGQCPPPWTEQSAHWNQHYVVYFSQTMQANFAQSLS